MTDRFTSGIALFTVGAALGSAIALLATPVSGRRARRLVRREVMRKSRDVSRLAQGTAKQLRGSLDRMHARGSELVDNAQEKAAGVIGYAR
jgi:gas vesicle protein